MIKLMRSNTSTTRFAIIDMRPLRVESAPFRLAYIVIVTMSREVSTGSGDDRDRRDGLPRQVLGQAGELVDPGLD
jgi:hypothetical protein